LQKVKFPQVSDHPPLGIATACWTSYSIWRIIRSPRASYVP